MVAAQVQRLHECQICQERLNFPVNRLSDNVSTVREVNVDEMDPVNALPLSYSSCRAVQSAKSSGIRPMIRLSGRFKPITRSDESQYTCRH
jgi:hypothetical protein